MEKPEWQRVSDSYLIRFMQECVERWGDKLLELETEGFDPEDWEAMTPIQKDFINSSRKRFNRIKYKLDSK